MGFVKIENYNGQKGYLQDDTSSFDVVEMDGIKYLVNFDEIENPSGAAYRILTESEGTANATKVTKSKLLTALEDEHYAGLEEMLGQ